jgi:muramidase (phage lysozyme)
MDSKLQAFLDLIAWSEGTSTSPITINNGYDVGVTGISGPWIFTDYSDHPNKLIEVRPGLFSTAAGRYQVLHRYFEAYKAQLGLPDFSPASQDAVAVQQMKERGVTADTINPADISDSIHMCSSIWASFPGNNYGQGGHTVAELQARYNTFQS